MRYETFEMICAWAAGIVLGIAIWEIVSKTPLT